MRLTEWQVEPGIGEDRAIYYAGGQPAAARLHWGGGLTAGQVEDAVLLARASQSTRGTARFASGEEALVDRLPRSAQEGAPIRLEIIRSAVSETGRLKRAQARPTDLPLRPAPSLIESLQNAGETVRLVRQLPGRDWEDIWAEAWSGSCDFPGGSLHFSPTPAMVLIDIDGALPPRDLGLAAVQPLARAIGRLDLRGSIGIDFPTLSAKADRKVVDDAFARALAEWPHERTAMNGFGFVQIVARMDHPSLLHRIANARAGAAARLVLRRAEGVKEPGALLLTVHPAVEAALTPAWRKELARRTGREIRVKADPALALEGGFAQAVPS